MSIDNVFPITIKVVITTNKIVIRLSFVPKYKTRPMLTVVHTPAFRKDILILSISLEL